MERVVDEDGFPDDEELLVNLHEDIIILYSDPHIRQMSRVWPRQGCANMIVQMRYLDGNSVRVGTKIWYTFFSGPRRSPIFTHFLEKRSCRR